jgi:hypothetical protein
VAKEEDGLEDDAELESSVIRTREAVARHRAGMHADASVNVDEKENEEENEDDQSTGANVIREESEENEDKEEEEDDDDRITGASIIRCDGYTLADGIPFACENKPYTGRHVRCESCRKTWNSYSQSLKNAKRYQVGGSR